MVDRPGISDRSSRREEAASRRGTGVVLRPKDQSLVHRYRQEVCVLFLRSIATQHTIHSRLSAGPVFDSCGDVKKCE